MEGYKKALPVIKSILDRYSDILQLECDIEDKPICNEKMICFNGIEEEGHETFVFMDETEEFTFCKTAMKEYDIVVCECLIVLNHFISTLKVSSDGFSGYVKDEDKYFEYGSSVENLDGTWGEALENVKEYYDIDYHLICAKIRDNLYYDSCLEKNIQTSCKNLNKIIKN